MVKLSHPIAPAELGKTVITALEAFRTGVQGRCAAQGAEIGSLLLAVSGQPAS
jgi:hypothetical protein